MKQEVGNIVLLPQEAESDTEVFLRVSENEPSPSLI